eukprot:1469053-Pleurochrysis_carterae.AAC.1
MPTSGTGVAADAMKEGSIPASSATRIEAGCCSKSRIALRARVCNTPKRKDDCSDGDGASGAPSPRVTRLGKKRSNAGISAATSLNALGGSGGSSAGSK